MFTMQSKGIMQYQSKHAKKERNHHLKLPPLNTTYLSTYLPTYPPTYLSTCLSACVHAHLP